MIRPLLALLLAVLLTGCHAPEPPCVMLVMDPLAKELACPCVGGYAQRDYAALAAHLTRSTGRRFEVVFADELGKGLLQAGRRPVGLIIGKKSVVLSDAKERGLAVAPLCSLTGKDGKTTLTGLFVGRKNDPAKSLADLAGRRFYFGPPDAEEKYDAALAALKDVGVSAPSPIETRPGCTDTALCVVESAEEPNPVGVISSYALPLLEGCGNVPPGALRVIGETKPVPFVTVFTTAALNDQDRKAVADALATVRESPELLRVMESKLGFVPCDPLQANTWPDWLGPHRDGHAAWLPEKMEAAPRVLWRKPLAGPGLAGLSSNGRLVFVAGRDPADEKDVFLAFNTDDGNLVWNLAYPAKGNLDYGQAPRATPTVNGNRTYLLGACGQLHCVETDTGNVIWKRDLAADFKVATPKWGFCGTPLLERGLLIVSPGAPRASVVALDAGTGRTVWQNPGAPAAYGTFIAATLGGRRQIVGHDAVSLGGWDVNTGRRLWSIHPPAEGDFNVPTPLVHEGRLLVVTEGNGARLYEFRPDGTPMPSPVMLGSTLHPETSSPVIADRFVFGWDSTLRALDLSQALGERWQLGENAKASHASLIACADRVLCLTETGELLLVRAAPAPEVMARFQVTPPDSGGYVHPALAGNRLFIRDQTHLVCLEL